MSLTCDPSATSDACPAWLWEQLGPHLCVQENRAGGRVVWS